VRRREQVERLVTAALVASVPVALYGLIQHLGLDPIDWQLSAAAHERVGSTIGNPIFVGGFMIMVVPLTLARLIEQVPRDCFVAALLAMTSRSSHCEERSDEAIPRVVLATPYLVLLALQVLTIIYTQS